jgi:ABC-type uncharacterized transport system auxiliary subunit
MLKFLFSRSVIAPAFLLAATVALTSCTPQLKQEEVPAVYYTLNPQPGLAEGLAKPSCYAAKSLMVEDFTIASTWRGRNFIYKTGPSKTESDAYHQFFQSPADMLTDAVRASLRSAQWWQSVSAYSGGNDADYQLEAHITELYGDFTNREAPQAVLGIQFFLLKDKGRHDIIQFSETYRAATPFAAGNPDLLAEAWNQSLAKALQQLLADIATCPTRDR